MAELAVWNTVEEFINQLGLAYVIVPLIPYIEKKT
jgi:hypothetical protein